MNLVTSTGLGIISRNHSPPTPYVIHAMWNMAFMTVCGITRVDRKWRYGSSFVTGGYVARKFKTMLLAGRERCSVSDALPEVMSPNLPG
jgi:hypothetical protein